MKTLLWKEWREKRLWALPLLASTIGLLPFGGYTFCESGGDISLTLSFLIALLMGASSFFSEIGNGAGDFLYSRPVSWKKMLLAKISVRFGIILAVSVLAAIAYRFTCPAPYAEFATISALSIGVGKALLFMGSAYFVGLASSVVLPGMIGSILILLIAAVAVGLEIALGNVTISAGWWGHRCPAVDLLLPYCIALSWIVSLIIAAILTTRFGITLATDARLKRFALITLCGVVVMGATEYVLFAKTELIQLDPQAMGRAKAKLSPNGKYIVWLAGQQDPSGNIWNSCYVSEVTASKRVPISKNTEGYFIPTWISNDTLYTTAIMKTSREGTMQMANRLTRIRVLPGLKLRRKSIDSHFYAFSLIGSPDGRKLLVYGSCEAKVIDTENLHVIASLTLDDCTASPWWQSNMQIGYLDKHRQAHWVAVSD